MTGDVSLLGLSPRTIAVYRALLRDEVAGIQGLASALSLTPAEVRAELDLLVDLDLLQSTGGAEPRNAVDPRVGLQALVERQAADVARRAAEVEMARATARLLADELAGSTRNDGGVVCVEGRTRVQREMAAVAAESTSELCGLMVDEPQPPAPPGVEASPMPGGHPGSGTTARVRLVYAQSVLRDAWMRRRLESLCRQGASVRTVVALPVRMVLADRVKAVIEAGPDERDGPPQALVVTQKSLLVALASLFDAYWTGGREVTGVGRAADESDAVDDRDRVLVRMLGAGMTDEVIARALAVSPRTVRRLISALYARLGVSSRFEAGAAAERLGWL